MVSPDNLYSLSEFPFYGQYSDITKRHTYLERPYKSGDMCNLTQPQIVCFHSRQCRRALHGSRRSLVADEVAEVQSCHRRVLGELNLSVEAMLMPTLADQGNGDLADDPDHNGDELLLVGHERLSSPIGSGCPNDLDSGFSGSSSASYRWVPILSKF
ncbi:hypothetical protein QAD02_015899 [Eretmocerus hayati]|uniref:Uncharacterized protein n=1 Tax=Eretmocerus hayati TaxID=131215 RepID=A0ACC2PCD1_9HYME|nr:hypothetical protein QAD02_015899 [Eretmocerus hayati]